MPYFVSSGQVSSGIILNEDAMYVYYGGTASSTTVNYRGRLHVSSGGTANNTTVNSGGSMFVSSGGTATAIDAGEGARLYFAVASNTYIQGTSAGSAFLMTNAFLSGYNINSKGNLYVENGGTANYTTVDKEGWMYVENGGTANYTTVNYRGRLHVSSGGAAMEIVENGGYVWFEDGANVTFTPHVFSNVILSFNSATVHSGTTANSTTVDDWGYLYVYEGGKVTGSLEITSGAVVSASSGSIIDFDVSGKAASAPALVNDLSLIQGTPSYTITVAADQANGAYTLAGGATGFAQIVTICNTDGVCGSLAVGGTVTLGERDYALNLDSSLLTLTVSGGAPAGGTAGDLNMDGRADIVMTISQSGHAADGSTGAWLIQENQTAAWGDLSTRNPGWEIFGTGKTAAGKNTDDVYIKNEGNILGAWTTGDDGKVNGWETIGEFDAETQIVGLGDFNADGQTDLLLRNTNGAVGCFFTSEEKHGWNYFQSLGNEWKLSAVGDLNGDGRDDVVLKHDAGFAGSWLTQADGTMAWADLDTLPAGFEIVGAGDFNGDGTDDVLLKSGNYYGAWLVNNGNAAGWMGLGDLGDVTVEQIADFNGDGTDDLRIRTSAGDLGAQLVMGADDLVWKYYGSVGAEWNTSLAALS